jgi:hypothetical protein
VSLPLGVGIELILGTLRMKFNKVMVFASSLMGYDFVKIKVTKPGMLHGPNTFCHFAFLMEKRFSLQKNGFSVSGACLLRKQ